MRPGRALSIGFAGLLVSSAMAFGESPEPPGLDRLARVAELYRDSALGFACQETISYTGPTTGRIQFAYLFIRDESGKLRDFRTWKTGTTTAQRGREVDPRDYHVPRYLESAYLWAFIFRADRQPLYRFGRVGEETVQDRPAETILFLPRGTIRKGLNDWAGYAWIDRETSQILRVEAYTPADWDRKTRLGNGLAKEGTSFDVERIVTDFGAEKNGMRFPSHVEIVKTRTTVAPSLVAGTVAQETIVRRVTQDYAHFEFFSVRTSEQIKRFVDGEGPLGP